MVPDQTLYRTHLHSLSPSSKDTLSFLYLFLINARNVHGSRSFTTTTHLLIMVIILSKEEMMITPWLLLWPSLSPFWYILSPIQKRVMMRTFHPDVLSSGASDDRSEKHHHRETWKEMSWWDVKRVHVFFSPFDTRWWSSTSSESIWCAPHPEMSSWWRWCWWSFWCWCESSGS